MAFIYPTTDINFKLSGKLLVVPVVSTANVSQLAADLIIASLTLKRLAVIDPSYFVPFVGGREDGEEGVSTPCELFGGADVDIVVVQQRSPVLKSQKERFVHKLLEFIKSSDVAAVLLLSGMDQTIRSDAQMLNPTYYIYPQSNPLSSTALKNVLSLAIPGYAPQENTGVIGSGLPIIPGSGLTRRIISSIPSDWPIPVLSLLQYALQGDNREDAYLLASVALKVLNRDSLIREWRQPSSWNDGLFGGPHDQSLYG